VDISNDKKSSTQIQGTIDVFKKTNKLPLISYFTLKLNVDALKHWLPHQQKIIASSKSDWNSYDIKEYKITILPTNPFTFYHNQVNEFSPSIGGMELIRNDVIKCVEWAWNQSFFYVNVSDPRITVFYIPIDEILHLLQTGQHLSQRLPIDEEVISLDIDRKFTDFHRRRIYKNCLVYSNELVSLSVVCASASDLVPY